MIPYNLPPNAIAFMNNCLCKVSFSGLETVCTQELKITVNNAETSLQKVTDVFKNAVTPSNCTYAKSGGWLVTRGGNTWTMRTDLKRTFTNGTEDTTTITAVCTLTDKNLINTITISTVPKGMLFVPFAVKNVLSCIQKDAPDSSFDAFKNCCLKDAICGIDNFKKTIQKFTKSSEITTEVRSDPNKKDIWMVVANKILPDTLPPQLDQLMVICQLNDKGCISNFSTSQRVLSLQIHKK